MIQDIGTCLHHMTDPHTKHHSVSSFWDQILWSWV